MNVVRLCRRCPAEPVTEGFPSGIRADALVRAFGQDGDAGLVLDLARAAGVETETPQPRGEGLLAELRTTADRQVAAWLAFHPPGPLAPAAGLVTLVTSGATPRLRQSISWLLVDPAARRRGIGRLLVEQALRHAWARAADRVWVESRSDWTAAIAFWRALGFSSASPAPPEAG